MQDGKPLTAIGRELEMLNQLDELGLPTVKAEKVMVDGKPGMIMEQYAQDSKEIVALSGKKVKLMDGADTSLLNQNSINDLTEIRNKMVNDNIKIDDLQFLIKQDGHIVISDPLQIYTNTKPSNNNLRMIDLLIEAAKK